MSETPRTDTPLSQLVGHALQLVYWMLDDSEEIADGKTLLDKNGLDKFIKATERLENELPAEEGYTSSYPNNVRLAIAKLEAALTAAQSRLREVEKDAARWIKFKSIAHPELLCQYLGWHPDNALQMRDMDAAIDAARSGRQEGHRE